MTTTDGPPRPEGAYLLDANVLIALVVVEHVHHELAERWLTDRAIRFASSPMTQGALLRFLVRQGSLGHEAQQVLVELTASERHEEWSDDLGFGEIDMRGVIGHRQVTDSYLVGLAAAHQARVATLDRGLAALRPEIVELITT